MKSLIVQLFGSYTPVMTQELVPYTAADGTVAYQLVDVVASGAAGLDWPWIMGVLLFAIVLYSMFRILGVFFR